MTASVADSAWQALGPARYGLGESPFWHPQERCLYWLDIAACQLLRAPGGQGPVQCWQLPSTPGCVAPVQGGGLVLALRDGVYLAHHWAGPLTLLARLDYDPQRVRANDGKCDALGRLWLGTVDETKQQHLAGLYCIDARQPGGAQVTQHVAQALTGNGLAFSPDGTQLYWADTPTHRVQRWAVPAHGQRLGAAQPWAQWPAKPPGWAWPQAAYAGRPDGATVAADGSYWVACYEGGAVQAFAPDGTLRHTLPLPLACPTMPCFGGDDLRTLFVTSAQAGRSAQELAAYPYSGAVLWQRSASAGLPVAFFQVAA